MNHKRAYFSIALDTNGGSAQLILLIQNFSVLCPNFSNPYIAFFFFQKKKIEAKKG